jgi:hypothetical protein
VALNKPHQTAAVSSKNDSNCAIGTLFWGLGNSMSESFAALFEESLKRSEMRTGEVITAEVIRIDHNHVVVNAGL